MGDGTTGEYKFIVFRQLSGDIKIKKYNIKSSFVIPEEMMALAKKTGYIEITAVPVLIIKFLILSMKI